MPQFRYRALRPTGGEIAGELFAADAADAAARLQAAGSYPIEVAASGAAAAPRVKRSTRVAMRELSLFTRQLATLIGAGVALDRALGLIGDGAGRAASRRLAGELLAAVNRGDGLSRACAAHPGLPAHYAMMLAAGEARGDLAAVLERLAQVLERNRAAANALLEALVYPASVVVVAFASVSFLLGFVLPRFQVLLTGLQREPPLAMRWMLALSALFRDAALPCAAVALAAVVIFAYRWRDPGFRLAIQKRLMTAPVLGALIGKVEAERLLYLLGNLVAAGVHLPEAVAATRDAMTSEASRAGLAVAAQRIERGDGVAAALAGVLPEVATELVRIGEETGELAPMLLKAGEILRREFEVLTPRLIGLVTPVSIVLLGLLVGAIAAGMLGTIMDIYDFAA